MAYIAHAPTQFAITIIIIITSRVPIRKKEFGRAMSNYDETYDETYDEIIETYDEIMMKL